jgi:o-succinylbenzoate synthase
LTDLRIESLDIYPIKLPMVRPFRIALGSISEYEGVLVRVELSDGTYGWGEAAPEPTITGETMRTAWTILEWIKPLVVGKDALALEDIMYDLNRAVLGHSSAKAAVDLAIHDALARNANLPLNALLGRRLTELETTQTVGLENLDETVRQATALRREGVTRMKIKIGGRPSVDVERIRAVRDRLGNEFSLTVDANQGYSVRQAISTLKHLERYDVEYCEQPVHYRDLNGLAEVRRKSPIPIMADESVHSTHDALEVTRLRAADMINIKLMKSGGIHEAKKIAAIAEAADIPCMVGCMVETRVGISAGCHFATSNRIVKYADLDSHTMLKFDPVQGGIELTGSKEKLNEGNGIAVEVDESALQRHLVGS